jgi:hypothetical protein
MHGSAPHRRVFETLEVVLDEDTQFAIFAATLNRVDAEVVRRDALRLALINPKSTGATQAIALSAAAWEGCI